MTEHSETKVERIEKEVDALKILFRRRPLLSIIILIWLVAPTIFGVYQFGPSGNSV